MLSRDVVFSEWTNMAQDLANTLLTKIAEEGHHGSAKVTVVGTGQVGMAAAFAMMTQVSHALYTHPLIYL